MYIEHFVRPGFYLLFHEEKLNFIKLFYVNILSCLYSVILTLLPLLHFTLILIAMDQEEITLGVGLEGRNICIDDDIDIINHHSPHSVNNNILSTANEDFRLSLMGNLYSIIEFMKEIEEKNYLIRTLLEKLENCKL